MSTGFAFSASIDYLNSKDGCLGLVIGCAFSEEDEEEAAGPEPYFFPLFLAYFGYLPLLVCYSAFSGDCLPISTSLLTRGGRE